MASDAFKESPFSEEEIQQRREWLLEHKQEHSLSWPDLARGIGDIGDSTVSAFCAGTYLGNNRNVATKVDRFLKAEASQRALAMEAPIAPGFLFTKTARLMLAQLQWAHLGNMVVAVGVPGIGKTLTLRHYARKTPNTFAITIDDASRSVTGVLSKLLRATPGGPVSYGRPSYILADIVKDRLHGLKACLVVDEASKADDAALEQLRGFGDDPDLHCGVVLAGNPRVLTRIHGKSRGTDFAQMSSRVSWPHFYEGALEEDVAVLCDAWRVTHPREREFLAKVAAQPGALRKMTQVLTMATLEAQRRNEPRTLSDLQDAYRQRTDFGSEAA